MMEGVSSEAASIAGYLALGNLIFLYDDNHITIEGNTNITYTEDVAKRFEAYGWHVQTLTDGNDTVAIREAIHNAQAETARPSLIKIRTHIGYGSPNKIDTAAAHGSPLGAEELKLVKKGFGFNPDESFVIPGNVLEFYRAAGRKGVALEKEWNSLLESYKNEYPDLAAEYESMRQNKLPEGWEKKYPAFRPADAKNGQMSTRIAGGKVLKSTLPPSFPT